MWPCGGRCRAPAHEMAVRQADARHARVCHPAQGGSALWSCGLAGANWARHSRPRGDRSRPESTIPTRGATKRRSTVRSALAVSRAAPLARRVHVIHALGGARGRLIVPLAHAERGRTPDGVTINILCVGACARRRRRQSAGDGKARPVEIDLRAGSARCAEVSRVARRRFRPITTGPVGRRIEVRRAS